MGVVERSNVELELVGDLGKMINVSAVVTTRTVHSREQGRRDRLVTYEPINIVTSRTLRDTLPAS